MAAVEDDAFLISIAYSINAWSWMKLYVLIIAHLEPDTVIFAILARIFANKKDQKGMNK